MKSVKNALQNIIYRKKYVHLGNLGYQVQVNQMKVYENDKEHFIRKTINYELCI